MFVVESNDLTNVQRVQALLYVHSYILETLNYFGPKKTKECIQRMENRYEIERLLIMYLSDFKVFNHPFFGEMFPKCNTTVKNANKTPDPSAFFVSHLSRKLFFLFSDRVQKNLKAPLLLRAAYDLPRHLHRPYNQSPHRLTLGRCI